MGHSLSELIAKHHELSRKLEALVSSLENESHTELSELDTQLTENLERILTAQSLGERDLRLRIEFVSELICVRTAGLVSLDREMQLLHDDYENIIRLHDQPDTANEDHI
ncbi:MAG: hypothetical protein AB3N20_14475 [Rhizobiaceae bacterium]